MAFELFKTIITYRTIFNVSRGDTIRVPCIIIWGAFSRHPPQKLTVNIKIPECLS